MELIPAIDIIDKKCVRLTQGDYSQKKIYNENPVEVAKMFEDHGLKSLHVVDLDGAKSNRIINFKVLEDITSKTKLVVDFGGGIKSDEDIKIAFESGAQMVTGGSIAIKNKSLFLSWLTKYGQKKIILGADVKDKKIAVNGWQETTDIELLNYLAEFTTAGIHKIICTDISKDGMLQGTSVELYKEILEKFPDCFLIASGGVSSIQDLEILKDNKLSGAIFGKAIYEGKIKLKELSKFL